MKRFLAAFLVFTIMLIQTISIIAEVPGIPEEEDLIVSESDLLLQQWLDAGRDVVIADNIQDAIDEQNDVIRDALVTYGSMDADLITANYSYDPLYVDEKIYRKYGIIVNGSSSGTLPDIVPDIDPIAYPDAASLQAVDTDGDYRLIGRNVNDEWVENPFYDPTAGPDIDQRNWVWRSESGKINSSVIGKVVQPTGIFDYDGLVDKYYVNFVFGFFEDYFNFLSIDFINDYHDANELYSNDFWAGIFDRIHFYTGFHIFNLVGYRGSSYSAGGPSGTQLSDMGAYLRYVVLPTEHSAGVAYMFHETGSGSMYYLSTFLYSGLGVENKVIPDMHAFAAINAADTVSDATSTITGTFDFRLRSTDVDLASYEIINVSSGTTINEPTAGTLSSGTRDYSRSVPITIDIPGTSQSVSITIRGIDVDGNIIEETATDTVIKLINGGGGSMTASSNAVLLSDNRGSEEYDVLQGIPTTEDLYANVLTDEYLAEFVPVPVTGSKTYTVTVSKTWDKYWTDPVSGVTLHDTGTRTKNYTVVKNYSYNILGQLDVFGLTGATINSSTLPGGTVNLLVSGYTPPIPGVVEHASHIDDPHPSGVVSHTLARGTLNGGTSKPATPNPDWAATAESATGTLNVRNDLVTFNGSTVMSDAWTEEIAPSPGTIPVSGQVNNDVLYEKDLTIPVAIENDTYASTGTVTYDRILSVNSLYPDTVNQTISGINDVVVHSPVVAYPDIPFDYTYNQVIDLDTTRANAVIGQNFIVEFPNNGQHRNIPGYGNRDYEEYIDSKQISPGCDMYLMSSDSIVSYIPAGQWYTLPTGTEVFEFRVPHWVDEGNYGMSFQVYANNTPATYAGLFEFNQNSSNVNYSAVEYIEIEVVGQIHDFKVIGTTDSNFNDFFNSSSVELYAGTNNRYGNVDSSHTNLIPIMPGTNTVAGYENKAVKKGHAVFFSVKTNGNMSALNSFVLVTPTFYHVDSMGNGRQKVDVWYESGGHLNELTASPRDLNMSLNNEYTAISDTDMSNTAMGNANLYGIGSYTDASDYIDNFVYSDARTANKIGSTSGIALDWEQRVFIGSTSVPAGVSTQDAVTGEQEYYGMYALPAQSMIVPTGTTRNNVLVSEITGGYIIVNFEIQTVPSYDPSLPVVHHLSYDDQAADMFAIEGYDQTQHGFSMNTGDVIFYHTDKSADQDYTSIGTH